MNKRPLSPHLSIYKLQMSSGLSILHRLTGAGLFCALSFLSWYFIIDVFYGINCECWTMLAKLVGILASIAFFYHMSAGIRHLIWDTGALLGKQSVVTTGIVIISATAILSCLFWLL